jgi:superoxide dismutase, Cu-Zn family
MLARIGAALALIPIISSQRELGAPRTVAWYESSRPAVLVGSGTLTMPNSTSKAITYDPTLAPIGAAITATIIPTSEGSAAEFTVLGLVPDREYAVAAHTKACGATASAAGPRFQHQLDPAAASAQPEDTSADNEISLKVSTDAAGAGTSRTTVPFTLTDRIPGSIVVYGGTPNTKASSQAVDTGARIACLTLSRR